MVFSTLLSAYLRYRAALPDYSPDIDCGLYFEECWVPAADIIRSHLIFGVINTFALLLSSLTVVLALYAARNNNSKAATRYLIATFFLGTLFLALKAYEWWEMKNGHFWAGYRASLCCSEIWTWILAGYQSRRNYFLHYHRDPWSTRFRWTSGIGISDCQGQQGRVQREI